MVVPRRRDARRDINRAEIRWSAVENRSDQAFLDRIRKGNKRASNAIPRALLTVPRVLTGSEKIVSEASNAIPRALLTAGP